MILWTFSTSKNHAWKVVVWEESDCLWLAGWAPLLDLVASENSGAIFLLSLGNNQIQAQATQAEQNNRSTKVQRTCVALTERDSAIEDKHAKRFGSNSDQRGLESSLARCLFAGKINNNELTIASCFFLAHNSCFCCFCSYGSCLQWLYFDVVSDEKEQSEVNYILCVNASCYQYWKHSLWS